MVRLRRPNVRSRFRKWKKNRNTKKMRKMTSEKRKLHIQKQQTKKLQKQKKIREKQLKKQQKQYEKRVKKAQKQQEKRLKKQQKQEAKKLKKMEKEKVKKLKKQQKEKAKKIKKREKDKAKKLKKKEERRGFWGTIRRHPYLLLGIAALAFLAGYAGLFGKFIRDLFREIVKTFWDGLSDFGGAMGEGIIRLLLNPWVLLIIGLAVLGLFLWWYFTKRHQVKVKVK